jgi:hypothetical protein
MKTIAAVPPSSQRKHSMRQNIKAATCYFAIVFAFGFIFGIIRVLLIAPRTGEVWAVIIETPAIVTISWIACNQVVRWFHVPPTWHARAIMGTLAFVLLMVTEFGLATILFHREITDYASGYQTSAGMIGLMAQSMFGLMPIISLAQHNPVKG